MNVAILVQEYYPSDVRVRKEVRALLEMGCSIDLFCLKGENESSFEIIDGVRVQRTSISKKRGSKLRYILEYFIFFIRAYIWMNKIIAVKKIDVVHIHTLPDFLVFAARPAKRKGAKLILDMHEITPEFFMSKYNIELDNVIIKLLIVIERKSLQYADYVITVNKQLQERFLSRAKIKNEISIVMNTVNDDIFPRLPKTKKEKFIAIYHGTLSRYYDFDFAIKAISKISSQLGNFEFHIYGLGAIYQEVLTSVSKLNLQHIVFVHGKAEHSLIPEILSHANLGILPIKKDIMSDLSFSNKIAEYIHCEIPVLTSELSGVTDYFPSDTIYYYKEGDEKDFIDKFTGIINNYEKSQDTASRAYALYQKINWDVMKKRLQQLYEKCK